MHRQVHDTAIFRMYTRIRRCVRWLLTICSLLVLFRAPPSRPHSEPGFLARGGCTFGGSINVDGGILKKNGMAWKRWELAPDKRLRRKPRTGVLGYAASTCWSHALNRRNSTSILQCGDRVGVSSGSGCCQLFLNQDVRSLGRRPCDSAKGVVSSNLYE